MSVRGRTILNIAAPCLSLALLGLVWLGGEQIPAPVLSPRHGLILLAGTIAAFSLLAAALNLRRCYGQVRALRRLRENARHLAAGNFKERIQIPESPEFAELAAEFNRMAEQLETLYAESESNALARGGELVRSERLTSVGFLAGGVAHQINNPLGTITGYAELSLRRAEGRLNPQALADIKQALQIIREECFRCKSITEKLLLLAKPSSRTREAMSVTRLIEEVVALTKGLAQSRDRQVRMLVEPKDPLTIWGNVSELRQVALNLTFNALEAIPPLTGEVVLQGARRAGDVELRVLDNGRGMTPEIIQRAFEPFFSDRRPDGERGLGLGLSIAHAIVQAHGGRIFAESDGPGRGSCFTLQFPALVELGDEKAA